VYRALCFLSGCGGKEPIKIGLAVELIGKQADVGINVRDARAKTSSWRNYHAAFLRLATKACFAAK
jgi:hypothetical protein